jgi:uncharacterized protein
LNSIVHFEIGCRDKEKAKAFYGKLFEWKVEELPHATMLRTGGDVGGHLNALGDEPHNYVLFYVGVTNLGESIEKAESLGGTRLVGPEAVPGGGRFAWIRDPEGNVIGLYEGEDQIK